MKKEEAKELLKWMIEKEKYNLTLEEDYDSYWSMPCPQEMWNNVIEFLVNLISNLEKEDINDYILSPDIHYDRDKVMSVWWHWIDSTFGLWIDFDKQTFWYSWQIVSSELWIKKVTSSEITEWDFPINNETIKNLSITLLEIIKE